MPPSGAPVNQEHGAMMEKRQRCGGGQRRFTMEIHPTENPVDNVRDLIVFYQVRLALTVYLMQRKGAEHIDERSFLLQLSLLVPPFQIPEWTRASRRLIIPPQTCRRARLNVKKLKISGKAQQIIIPRKKKGTVVTCSRISVWKIELKLPLLSEAHVELINVLLLQACLRLSVHSLLNEATAVSKPVTLFVKAGTADTHIQREKRELCSCIKDALVRWEQCKHRAASQCEDEHMSACVCV